MIKQTTNSNVQNVNEKNNVSSTKNIDQAAHFLQSTLHEMRTPIQTIIGSVELLNTTPLDKEQLEYIHQIQFSADVLLSLANDILDFSKIRSQEFKLENIPYNVRDLVERVTDFVSIESFNKGIEIVADIFSSVPQEVLGDPVRVQQILLNIVKNAVKFTEKGYIHIIAERKEEDALLFQVEDTGIGISENSRKNLFTDFYQADTSTTRKYGGTGLGLSISKSLVTAMHGKIGVNENPNGGSIFWFSIPCKESPTSNSIENQWKKTPLVIPKKTRVLLVDDNFLARKSFEAHLQSLGITIFKSVASGEDALSELKSAAIDGKPFTICFIDLIMPKMDGWHLAAKINEDKLINDAKLYLIVPEGQIGGEAKMKMLNWFNGYLYKPIKEKKLYELLRDSINQTIDLKTVENNIANQKGVLINKDATINENKIINFAPLNNDSIFARGIKILVAEDHIVNRKLITTFLKKFGAKVLEAQDGIEAVQAQKENNDIDIIFMDIQMPNLNGLDATAQIRQNGFEGVIIACTANNAENDFEKYKKFGINDILQKPFKSTRIKEIISKWKNACALSLQPSKATKKADAQIENIVWDKEDFLDTVNGDEDLTRQLLLDFISQSEELISKIPNCARIKNFDGIQKISHTLKGSAATMSAINITRHASLLNKASHEKNMNDLKTEYIALKTELEKFKRVSKNWEEENEVKDKLSYTHEFL